VSASVCYTLEQVASKSHPTGLAPKAEGAGLLTAVSETHVPWEDYTEFCDNYTLGKRGNKGAEGA